MLHTTICHKKQKCLNKLQCSKLCNLWIIVTLPSLQFCTKLFFTKVYLPPVYLDNKPSVSQFKCLFLCQLTFDRTIKHPVGDGNSDLGASKSLNFEKQPRYRQNHLFYGTLCYGLDANRFRPKFRLKPKIALCFRFLLHRNRKHRN